MRPLHRFQLYSGTRAMVVAVALVLALISVPALAGPYMLFDLRSGRVLEHEGAFKRWYPASLSKLMTAYVTFRAIAAGELSLNSPVRISQNAAQEPPSKMGYPPGSVLTLDNALKIILVKSANDIATAIAETVGGSEQGFAARMNNEAHRLGMQGSHFVNPHGLPSTQQYTTAHDMALLVRALRTEFAEYAPYFSIEGIRDGDKVMENYNLLIGRFDGADGMKTGYICSAGFNLIATATRGRRTLAAIVLGASSEVDRAERAAELLERGFATRGTVLAPTIASIRPTSSDLGATDMRPQICSAEAIAERAKLRDDEGRLVVDSPYVEPMTREPHLVAVGTIGPVASPGSASRYADIPLPTPRPDYTPQQVSAGEGG